MKSKAFVTTLFLSVLMALPVFAKSIVIDVPLHVGEQSFNEDDALMWGWQQAAARLGGDTEKASLAPLAEIKRHILQYRYQKDEGEGVLRVVFDEPSLNQALIKLGAMAATKYPVLLAWVATTDEKKEQLVDADDARFKGTLEAALETLPLTVFLPAFDLEDRADIDFNDLWQDKLTKLGEHSKRYHVDGFVVIKISPLSDKTYQSEWTLSYQGRQETFTPKSGQVQELLHNGFEQVTDLLKEKPKAPYDLYLSVQGLNDFSETESYNGYFKHLPGILDVAIDGVTPKGVLYKLRVSVSKDELRQQIARGKRLEEQASSNKAVLSYHVL